MVVSPIGTRVDEVLTGGGDGLVVVVTGPVSTFLVELESIDESGLGGVALDNDGVVRAELVAKVVGGRVLMMEVLPMAVLELEVVGGAELGDDEGIEDEDVVRTELGARVVGGRVLIMEVLSTVVLVLKGDVGLDDDDDDDGGGGGGGGVSRAELVAGGGGGGGLGGKMIEIPDFEVEVAELEAAGGVLRVIGDVGE